MKDNETINNFEYLVKHLSIAMETLNTKACYVVSELKQSKSETTIEELKKSYSILYAKIKDWYKKYQTTGDILQIGLKEYDWVSKEASYILDECTFIDGLYAEAIEFTIACIGAEMCDAIRKGGKPNE